MPLQYVRSGAAPILWSCSASATAPGPVSSVLLLCRTRRSVISGRYVWYFILSLLNRIVIDARMIDRFRDVVAN